jgi:hypothetical protein
MNYRRGKKVKYSYMGCGTRKEMMFGETKNCMVRWQRRIRKMQMNEK